MALCTVRLTAEPPTSPALCARGPPIAEPLPFALVTAPGPVAARMATLDGPRVGIDAPTAEADAIPAGPDVTPVRPGVLAVGAVWPVGPAPVGPDAAIRPDPSPV